MHASLLTSSTRLALGITTDRWKEATPTSEER
jgi:hypothetical protein